MADNTLQTKLLLDFGGFAEGMEKAKHALEGFLGGLTSGSLKGFADGLVGLVEAAGPLALVAGAGLAVAEAWKALGESITITNEWNLAALKLSKQLGITTEDASVLAETLKVHGIDTAQYSAATNAMTRQLAAGSAAFKQLGVATREPNGELRNSQDIMEHVIKRLNEMPDGTAKNIAGQAIFKKAWLESREILKLTADALQKTQHHMEELGTVVTPRAAQNSKDFKIAVAELHATFEAFFINIGQRVLPVLTAFVDWLTGIGTVAVKLFRTALDDVSQIAEQAAGDMAVLSLAQQDLNETITKGREETHFFATFMHSLHEAIVQVGLGFESLGAQISFALVGGFDIIITKCKLLIEQLGIAFTTLGRIFKEGVGGGKTGGIVADFSATMDAIGRIRDQGNAEGVAAYDKYHATIEAKETAFGARMRLLRTQQSEGPSMPSAEEFGEMAKRDKKKRTPGGNFDTKDKSAEQFQEYKKELDKAKDAEENWYNWNTARELAFWVEKLELTKAGSKAETMVQAEVTRLRKEENKKEQEAEATALKGSIASEKAAGEAKIALIQDNEKRKIEVLKSAQAEAAEKAKSKIEIAKIERPEQAPDLEFNALAQEKAAQDRLAQEIAQLRAKDLADEKTAINQSLQLRKAYYRVLDAEAGIDFNKKAAIREQEVADEAATLKQKAKLEANEELEQEKARSDARKREQQLEDAAGKRLALKRKELATTIEGYMQPLVQGFSNGIKKIIDGSLSFGDAIKGIGQMLLGAFTDIIGQMVTQWLGGLAKMLAQWIANLVFQQSADETAAATAIATGAASRTTQAVGAANLLALNAAASAASVPFVGWLTWPAAMASALAAGLALVPAAAAAGGFDIPPGLNPVTQLHAEEMVLPANLANVVREGAAARMDGGAPAPAEPSGGGSSHTTVNIQALDGPSVGRILRSNPRQVSKVFREFKRNNTGRRR